MYITSALSEINSAYISNHGELTDEDLVKVNLFVAQIKKRNGLPQLGDVIELEILSDGEKKLYPNCRVARVAGKRVSVCLNVISEPHVDVNGKFTISGGRFISFDLENLKEVSLIKAKFWTWGTAGYFSPGGSLFFEAPVQKYSVTINEEVYA